MGVIFGRHYLQSSCSAYECDLDPADGCYFGLLYHLIGRQSVARRRWGLHVSE